MRNPFDFELRDLWLATIFAVMGFLFSLRGFLLWLNKLTPWQGLLIYYVIVFVFLFGISRAGLISFIDNSNSILRNIVQVAGIVLIVFSFGIVFNWTSAYIQYVATGSFSTVSVIYLMSEDGSIWYLWSLLIPLTSTLKIQLVRVLTFVLTPFLLTFIGGLMIKGKADFSWGKNV